MVRFAVPPDSTSGPAVHSTSVSVVAIIPARFASSRFPGKALADIAGRPMIEHVYRRTSAAPSVGVVIVATHDQRICGAPIQVLRIEDDDVAGSHAPQQPIDVAVHPGSAGDTRP